MLIVGLTGGMGSGKTTVAHLFSKRGVPIIDADQIARELTVPGGVVYEKIRFYFGKTIINQAQEIDRCLLRRIVFADLGKRQWLESLLHPLIRKAIIERITALIAPYCLVVVPLLLENNQAYSFINRVLVVDVPEAIQIQRVCQRDHLSHQEVRAILMTQLPRMERLKKAHDVIDNDISLNELSLCIQKLHQYYLALSNHNE